MTRPLSMLTAAALLCLLAAAPARAAWGDACTDNAGCSNGLTCKSDVCVSCDGNDECEQGLYCLDALQSATNVTTVCREKPLFEPFTTGDALASVFSFIGAIMAAGGGLGGGGIFVPIFILVAGFGPHQAVPLSQAMIFGGSIVNFAMNWRSRHPLVVDRPMIDYPAVLALQPLMLGGTIIGVFLNKIFPSWLIVLLLFIVLAYGSWRTFNKGKRIYGQESAAKKAAAGKDGKLVAELAAKREATSLRTLRETVDVGSHVLTPDGYSGVVRAMRPGDMVEVELPLLGRRDLKLGALVLESDELAEQHATPEIDVGDVVRARDTLHVVSSVSDGLLFVKDDVFRPAEVQLVSDASAIADAKASQQSQAKKLDADQLSRLRQLRAEDRQQVRPTVVMAFVLVLVSVLSLLRGGRAGAPSIIGITNCSTGFWLVTVLSLLAMVAVTLVTSRYLVKRQAEKQALAFPVVDGDIEWTPKNSFIYPLLSTIAGVAGGILGIGGGMIMGPLLLELGMLPAPTSATSATTVMLTSASATVQFLLLNLLLMDYAVWFAALGFIATFIGQVAVNWVVRKYKMASAIVFTIVAVMWCSTVLMVFVGVQTIIEDVSEGRPLGFRDFCT